MYVSPTGTSGGTAVVAVTTRLSSLSNDFGRVHRRASAGPTEEANCRARPGAVQTRGWRTTASGADGSRGLPLAGLAVRQGLGRVAGKLTRDEQKQLDRFTREAERYVAVLGDMKGVAMKVGQLVSFLDAGAIPDQYRAAYQQIIGALQADAPPMPFETVRDVLERELGRPVDEVFAWIDERPMAAASIGQVHAARLPDGREVVVKVQYPGVGDAIRADLQNTELIASFANPPRSCRRSGSPPTRPPSPRRSPTGSPRSSTTGSRRRTRPSSAPTTRAIRSSASPRSSRSSRPSGSW